MHRHTADIAFLSLGATVLIAAFVASGVSKAVFLTYFGNEDSITETATAVFLVLAGCVLWHRVMSNRIGLPRGALTLGLLYGLVYV